MEEATATRGGAASWFAIILTARVLRLEQELQRQLNDSTRQSLVDLAKRRRADVVVREPEIRVVNDVKELRSELEAHGFAYRDILEQREIPLLKRRPGHDVAARVAELSGLSSRIQPLKRTGVEPLLRRA